MSGRRGSRAAGPRAFPSAAMVGAAIVAACERTGEEPLQVMAAPRGLRAPLCVADAMGAAFPTLSWPEIGRMAGVTWSKHVQALVVDAHRRGWWIDEGAFASRAAYLALRPEVGGEVSGSSPRDDAAGVARGGSPRAAGDGGRAAAAGAANSARLRATSPPSPGRPPSRPSAVLPPRAPAEPASLGEDRGGASAQPRTACAPEIAKDPPRRKLTGPILAGSGVAPPYIEPACDPEREEDPLLATFRPSPPPSPCGRLQGPLPDAAAVVSPSSRCGSRTAGAPKVSERKLSPPDPAEAFQVRALRGANVPWSHIHRQIGAKGTVDDLRRKYDPAYKAASNG